MKINIGDKVRARWWAPCPDLTMPGNSYNACKLVEVSGAVEAVTVEQGGTIIVVRPDAASRAAHGQLLRVRPQSALGYPLGWVAVRPEWLVWGDR